jgi:hypothetical protein
MSRLARIALVVVVACATVVGCAPPDEEAAALDGLLVLSGEVGATTLQVHGASEPEGRPVALPDPGTAWVAAGRGNVLLATMIDGRTFVSAPLGDDDPSWRPVEPRLAPRGTAPEGPLYFGSWDPAGGIYAMLAADLATASDLRILVVDPSLEDGASEVAVDAVPAPAAPSWIDGDRVLVLVDDVGARRALIVDTPTGDVADGPRGSRLLTTSGDGTMLAHSLGAGSPVEVLPTTDWLAERSSTIRLDPPAGTTTPAVLALDRTGGRLAIVWTDGDGMPREISIHVATADWRSVASVDLTGASVASASWLR